MGNGDNLDSLRAFCGVLEAANPGLQSLASQLDGLTHTLGDAETSLREALDGLQGEVEALTQEASSSGGEVEQAAQALGTRANQELDARVPGLEQHVNEARERIAHTLEDEAAALGSALGSLLTDGFEPALAVLAQRQTAFGEFADEVEHGLAPFDQELLAGGQTAAAAEQATAEITATAAAVDGDHSDLGAAQWEERKVRLDLPQDTKEALAALQGEVHGFHAQLTEEWNRGVQMVVERMESVATDAAKAIQEAAEHAAAVVDTASGALDRAEIEVERSAATAQGDEARATQVAALAPQIATAEEEILQIHSVLEALQQ